MSADRQLIVAVEGTASLGFYWQSILSDYLEKIIRSFAGNELAGQKPANSSVEFALVSFNTHGNYAPYIVQRTGWTKNPDTFLEWISCIPFYGGGFSDAAITEGLAEALMMFPIPSNGTQSQQNANVQKHCILVAASNPYPLPTPVYQPQLEQSDNKESPIGSRLADAESLAKFFPQISVSLSVICPKQLPKLRAIYDAGKRNPRSADQVDNAKNPNFLVLISESFIEARNALSRSGVVNMAPNQSPVKMDMSSVTAVSGPIPTPMVAVNGSVLSRQPIPVPNAGPTATVKVEPSTVTSMGPGSTFPHIPSSVPRPTSQPIPTLQASSPSITSQEVVMGTNDNNNNNNNMPELKPTVSSIPPSLRPVPPAANVNILNNLSQARQVMNSAALTGGASIGLQSIGQTPMAMHMSNMISSSVPPPTSLSSGQQQPGITNLPTGSGAFGGPTQVQQFTSSTMPGNSNPGVSQPMGNLQGSVSMGQSAPGMNQGNNMSGPQMVQNGGIGVNQNLMNGNGTMMPTPGIPQQVQGGMQSIVNSNTAANMQLPQQTSSGLQSAQSKYVKVWEGNLSGQRQGQPVFITRLEGYRSSSASETLAANWPPTMQIVRLISQDHMNNKQYVGKADFLVFRAMNQHGFLGQLQEKKLCAVIQLPSQTLLLSVSDKACRLIGMLFPGDMVVFKPQISSQQQQQMQQQLQQQQQHPQLQQQHPQLQQQQIQQPQQQLSGLQAQQPQINGLQAQQQPPQQLSQMQQNQQMPQLQQQQIPQLQQQTQLSQLQQQQQPQLPQLHQQLQQQQQMVGAGTGSAYVQGQGGRSQLVSQGQVPTQGSLNMPGGGGGYIG